MIKKKSDSHDVSQLNMNKEIDSYEQEQRKNRHASDI